MSTRTKTIFFPPVFLGIVSRIFASKWIHCKQLNAPQFMFQPYRWRLKLTKNVEEEMVHVHKACALYTNRQ